MIALTLTVILECWRTLVGRIWLNEKGTSVLHSFYLHDAMLARILAMALCLSVSVCLHLSVASWSSIETDERIELVLAWELFSTYPACILRKFGYLQSKSTFFWNFVPNSRLRKFRHGISIVEACYQLCSTKMDAQNVINWTVVGHLS